MTSNLFFVNNHGVGFFFNQSKVPLRLPGSYWENTGIFFRSELMSTTQLELMGSTLAARVAAGKGDDGKVDATSSLLGKPTGPWQSPPAWEITLQRNS